MRSHTHTFVFRRKGGEKNSQIIYIVVILFGFRNTFGTYGTNYAFKGDSIELNEMNCSRQKQI